ncbi:MAG: BamA/TamA family outer membrane protein, partial [Bacteroidota bacterium]|nr:BamA/TamA family outer membrane protein [Bacteroidota bacterium]
VFKGNKSFSSSSLKEMILSSETPWWFWKFLYSFSSLGSEAKYFDSTNIPIDITSLTDYYHANGFFLVKINPSYEIDSVKHTAILKYDILEGRPSTYGKFEIDGLNILPDNIAANVSKQIIIDTTKQFNQEKLQDNINAAASDLLNTGYMLARFDSTYIVTDTNRFKSDIKVFFTPGNRYKIDTINVITSGEGAPYVDKDLLKRITDIRTGEYYNAEKVRRGQSRLFRTGVFNSVSLSSIEKDTSSFFAPLKLEGSIGKLNELSPEIILNNQQSALNIGLGATYIKKNFLGQARKLTFQNSFGIQDLFHAQIARLIKKFSFRDTTLLGYVDSRVTIDQPYLFGKTIFGSWVTYATINKQPSYNNTVYGSKVTLDFELPTYTLVNKLSTFYSVEESKEVYKQGKDSLSSKLISSIGADINRITTDNILFPTQGYIISILFEEDNAIPYMFAKVLNKPYSSSLFYKTTLNASFYTKLGRSKNTIFATKIKIGHLQAYHGDYRGIPINRAYYAGGSNSVRGWRSNELIPKETPFVVDILGQSGQNVKGGTFLFEGSFELRLRFLESFGIAFFNDYGNSWLGYKKFRYDEIAVATGIGFRYYTSVAPFRIDFGWRTYDPANKQTIFQRKFWKNFEFHFGIGEAF